MTIGSLLALLGVVTPVVFLGVGILTKWRKNQSHFSSPGGWLEWQRSEQAQVERWRSEQERLKRQLSEQERSERRAKRQLSEQARLKRQLSEQELLKWRRLEQARLAPRQREQRLEQARLARQQRRSERRLRSEQARLARSERLRTAHFLLAIAVLLLPPSERDRYLEEFRAELLDVRRDTRLWHARSLLRGVVMLRLRGDAKNKAARRAKD
jgi:hypothetical protein